MTGFFEGCETVADRRPGNEQEIQRNPTTVNGTTIEAISSNMDDKTMHETYLWPFANAVRAGTASIMCSYQRLNGSYGCQNSKALNGLLKEELGFQGRSNLTWCCVNSVLKLLVGYVMSDWMATHAGLATAEAGMVCTPHRAWRRSHPCKLTMVYLLHVLTRS